MFLALPPSLRYGAERTEQLIEKSGVDTSLPEGFERFVWIEGDFVVPSSKGFNPSEPRDADGRWTSGGAAWEIAGTKTPAQQAKEVPASVAAQAKEWHAALNFKQKQSLGNYMGQGARWMNDHLRGKQSIDTSTELGQEMLKRTEMMVEVAKTFPKVTELFHTFRGISAAAEARIRDAAAKGKVFEDAGFVSTSLSPFIASKFARGLGITANDAELPPATAENSAILRIRVPPGASGVHLSSARPNLLTENEFLLPPGSKFKILSVEPVAETVATWKSRGEVAKARVYNLELIVDHAAKAFLSSILKFNPNQPRDSDGRWTSGGGGHAKPPKPAAEKKPRSLNEYYDKYTDHTATAETILHSLSPNERKEVHEKLAAATRLPETSAMHTDVNGNYTAERLAIHQKIVDHFLSPENIHNATPVAGHPPTFIVLGGRGGSGKSAFTNGKINEFNAKKFIKLDSDEIKAHLPEYKGWNANQVHQESSDIFNRISQVATGMGLNVLHDATMKSGKIAGTVQQLKALGYRVEGHYMFVPPQVSAQRALGRYLGKGPSARGRLVPVDVILQNTHNERNFEALKPAFDKWSAYDNRGSSPQLIGRKEKVS